MNNLKLNILEHVSTHPYLSRGGLIDAMGGRERIDQDIGWLIEKGYLADSRTMELTDKGLARIDSGSFRNRMKMIGVGAIGIILSVIAVVIGNWLSALLEFALH